MQNLVVLQYKYNNLKKRYLKLKRKQEEIPAEIKTYVNNSTLSEMNIYMCPTCKRLIGVSCTNYCSYCGQKLQS